MKNDLRAFVGDVDAAAVPFGLGHAIGNKVRLPLYDYDSTVLLLSFM